MCSMALCRQHGLEDPVCVVDLGAVARLFRDWVGAMPRVVPFYAVKANNDEGILAMLAALGAGFDCASDAEVSVWYLHCLCPHLGKQRSNRAQGPFGQLAAVADLRTEHIGLANLGGERTVCEAS